MEQRKKEVESAAEMYRFIDQAYSWALKGMKFVVMLNVEECCSVEKCDQFINKFDDYMRQNPPITQASFKEIFAMADLHGNRKCIRQCEFAEQKCQETLELFKKRRQLLIKAKSQQMKALNQTATSSNTSSTKKHRSRDASVTSSSSSRRHRTPSALTSSVLTSSAEISSPRRISVQSLESKASSSCASDDVISAALTSLHHRHHDVSSSHPLQRPPVASSINKSSSMRLKRYDVTKPKMSMTSSSLQRSNSSLVASTQLPNFKPKSHKLTQVQLENISKANMIIDELISTEREYVRSLDYVIRHYVPEMTRLDLPHALRCKRNVIFGNVERIYEFHSNHFLHELENCRGDMQAVGECFQIFQPSFGLYALYSKNKPQSDQLLAEHGNEFFKKKQNELEDKMNLASYLLKPVQRMAKYALLLHGLAKRAGDDVSLRHIRAAENLVKFQLRHGNDLLTMDSIRDCDVNLKEQGNLLRQEQFTLHQGRKKITRRVFLFEELILLAKPTSVQGAHDLFHYKCSYKTAEIGLTENIGDSGTKFEIWFRRRTSKQDTFVLQATSRAVKRQWVDEIRNLLWKQAFRNKDVRKSEMSSMGIGSKPHIDLTSCNTIVDRHHDVITHLTTSSHNNRFMSTSSLPQDGASGHHQVNHTKRPHSIVSSSTSGCASSMTTNSSITTSWQPTMTSHIPTSSFDRRYATLPSSFQQIPFHYRDFHSIAEAQDEGIPESIASSSVCTTPGQTNTSHTNDDDDDDVATSDVTLLGKNDADDVIEKSFNHSLSDYNKEDEEKSINDCADIMAVCQNEPSTDINTSEEGTSEEGRNEQNLVSTV